MRDFSLGHLSVFVGEVVPILVLVLGGLRNGALAQALAHLLEKALGLLVILLLARICILQQSPGLLVSGVKLNDLFEVALTIHVVLEAKVRLRTAEKAFDVLRIILENVL